MRFSIGVPNCREGRDNPIGTSSLPLMLRLAEVAEECGYTGLWLNEFVSTAYNVMTGDGPPPTLFDPLITTAYLASATRRMEITQSVLILPLHEPLMLARQIATLDTFSGGRMRLGVGLGGSVEEFRRYNGRPGVAHRGKLMDEYLQALRLLWTERRVSFAGEYVTLENVETHPKPIQQPLPILMAGHAENVLKRTARFGDTWIDSSLSPQLLRDAIGRLRGYEAEVGRPQGAVQVSRQMRMYIAETQEEAESGYTALGLPHHVHRAAGESPGEPVTREPTLIGSAEMIRKRVAAYQEVGVTEFCACFHYRTTEEAERQVRLFAQSVMPAFT